MSTTANAAQQQAIRIEGHCLIQACPGAGKTYTLKHRAKHLLTADPASRLCAVTFTADAAAELEHRIRDDMPQAGDRLISGTFHSLCKRQIEQAGMKFVLLNDGQQGELIRRAYLECLGTDTGISLESAVAYIESMKCRIDPLRLRGDIDPRTVVYETYQFMLQQMGALDFADLLIEAVRGMQDGRVKPLPVTYMLIDEYQDTDPVQEAWVREHIRQGVMVTIVGDDDQSIYGWRSALGYEGMERFRIDANATMVKLNMTYRCAQEILVPAAKLIVHNAERVPKVLQTNSTARGAVRVRSFKEPNLEIDAVARAILSHGEPHRWGILARTNAQLDAVERALQPLKIPYTRSGGKSFWELPGPALFLSICDSLAQNNMLGIDQLLRKSGVKADVMERIHGRARSKEPASLQRFIAAYDDGGKAVPSQLAKRVREWQGLLHKKDDECVYEGIATFIKSNARLFDGFRKPEDKAKDDRALVLCAKSFVGLGGHVGQRITILRTREQNKSRKPVSKEDAENKVLSDGVRIMTLHSSKGLEFDNVWIVGCEQGTLPSKQSPIDEERRLMYVGMTRARLDLTLSYVVNDRYPPSVFLAEAGLQ